MAVKAEMWITVGQLVEMVLAERLEAHIVSR